MMAKPIRDLELHYPMIQLLIITVNTLGSITSHSLGNELALKTRGHVRAVRKRSHQWGVSLTPNSTKTIGRMTCHCFLRPLGQTFRAAPTLVKTGLERAVQSKDFSVSDYQHS